MCLSVSDKIDLGIGIATILVSVISCFIAIRAVYLTKKEIKIQNERDLLERRLNNYIACRTVYDSVKDSLDKLPIKRQDDKTLELEPVFRGLLRRGFLRKGRDIAKGSLKEENREGFLKNIESIRNIHDRCKILFDGKSKNLMCEFLNSYEETLMAMLQYQELMDNDEEYPLIAREVHESEYVVEVKKTSGDLKKKFNLLEKNGVLEKMYSEIEISKI